MFDPELIELHARHMVDGDPYRVEVYKIGGGTLGRAYEGRWGVRIVDPDSHEVLLETDDLTTGTPHTHSQIPAVAAAYVPDWEPEVSDTRKLLLDVIDRGLSALAEADGFKIGVTPEELLARAGVPPRDAAAEHDLVALNDTERALITAALRECLTAWPTYEPKVTLSVLAERIENGGCDCTFHDHRARHG